MALEIENSDKDQQQLQQHNKEKEDKIEGHRLQYTYCIWYSRRTPGKLTNAQTYDQNLQIIATFSSVEEFWSIQSYLIRPGDLAGHSDIHLFKEGIKPLWEV